jgi:glycosidase
MTLFEFHISHQARDRYQVDKSLFSLSGNVIIADFQAAHQLAQQINIARFPEQTAKASDIYAMGLIDEILHLVIRHYRLNINSQIFSQTLQSLDEHIGKKHIDAALKQFTTIFPPLAVYQGKITSDDYLRTHTEGLPNRQIALEEMLLLWLANINPAFAKYQELFDDHSLSYKSRYTEIIKEVQAIFDAQPSLDSNHESLIQMLRAPALASPDTLAGQLQYIQDRWGIIIGGDLQRVLKSLDFIKEGEKVSLPGPGPVHIPVYDPSQQHEHAADLMPEEERFSPDSDWMPRLVMLAKNAHVWLSQLSKKYHRTINRLDQVPTEELDQLARWGFSGLWLIGLWERSPASQRIKQRCGQPDAVSSAYSLYDYVIANDLGGEEAYINLRHRAWKQGIRLAADMVPNHVGITSKWIIEHPDWFVSLDYSPFPNYTFNGENLSQDERVGVYLEDHYYTRSDAAVVFKRVDHWTNDEKFIYHGNDGTAMPWNDTAQLDFLNPDVREAVIQTILHVARKFPIIRFDAAMTITKKHFQRLWFPQPGSGGDIPSRAEFGMSKSQFDQAMPEEFWREVVERVAQEVPETLLLAEAFWMMEGYFVRTLGMHRVYNSAFMHMLRDEKNAEYRQLIKNTLEFDAQILKRYVSFMNNPDEETAIEQFGTDDKYFGICTLLATLPGLPMFGHGQIEGFREKYGMEYHRAKWEEYPDSHLVKRHEREIFPLLHQRSIFAEVEHFRLYDFYTREGHVDEHVFAFSNCWCNRGHPATPTTGRALVIYHNRWADTHGWIKTSVAYKDKAADQLVQTTLGSGLGLENKDAVFTLFQDHVTGLEYIRNNREIHDHGLYFELNAYQYHVFLDFREINDNVWGQYAQLTDYLNGRGVPNMEEAMREVLLQPLHYPFRELVNANMFQHLLDKRARIKMRQSTNLDSLFDEVAQKMKRLLANISEITAEQVADDLLIEEICQYLAIALRLTAPEQSALDSIECWLHSPEDETFFWGTLFSWLFIHKLGETIVHEGDNDIPTRSSRYFDDWLLGKIITQTLEDQGLNNNQAQDGTQLVKVLVRYQNWYVDTPTTNEVIASWLSDDNIRELLKVNRHQDVLWFHQESFDCLLRGMSAIAIITITAESEITKKKVAGKIKELYKIARNLKSAADTSEYQVEKFLNTLKT